nr:MbnP family protein [uncultured Chitinophaga sp.]
MILRIFTSYIFRCVLICLPILWLCGCAKKDKKDDPPPVFYTQLSLDVSHEMNGSPLVRGTRSYTNAAGEKFIISQFRYYLSNFALVDNAGKIIPLASAYFLINDAVDSTKRLRLDSVPAGTYTAIRFLIGVDSARNNSGVQSGALAPENGMFWTWNSGYIMAKLEGTSDAVASPTHEFQWHVGGFKGPYNVLKTVQLPLSFHITPYTAAIPHFNMVADLGKWFAPNTASFAQTPVIMAPGEAALNIAKNYQQMFSIKN